MEKYEILKMEVIFFDNEDVITGSPMDILTVGNTGSSHDIVGVGGVNLP